MKVLLDTCVISELARPNCHPAIRQLLSDTPEEHLYLSVITIGELTKGVSLLAESHRKQALQLWLYGLLRRFSAQILPITEDTAEIWGKLTARAQGEGKTIPIADGLIAATALGHGLAVVTRNSRDFVATGVLVIDPWSVDAWEE